MLYNRTMKYEFMEAKQYDAFQFFFNYSGIEEENLKLDIGEFPHELLIRLLKKYTQTFPDQGRSMGALCTGLNAYRKYCRGIHTAPGEIEDIAPWMLIDNLQPPKSDSLYLFTEEDLRGIAPFLDPRQKYLMYALYEGCKGANTYDFFFLETSQVHEDTKTIEIAGKEISVTDNFLQVIREAKNYDLAPSKANFATSTVEGSKRYHSLVYKNVQMTDTLAAQQSQLRVSLFNMRKQLGFEQLTQANLLYSGFINQIFKQGLIIGLTQLTLAFFMDDNIKPILERYDLVCHSKTAASRRRNMLLDYLRLYPNKFVY